MLSVFDFQTLWPGLILLIACIDDLRSRKIHNKLILILFPCVLSILFFTGGFQAVLTGFYSSLLALIFAIPLTLFRAIGGGDLKLLFILSLCFKPVDFIYIFLYSFPWALVLGLFKVVLDKRFKEFFINLKTLLLTKKVEGLKFHTLPFSIALFMAWLSFLTLKSF